MHAVPVDVNCIANGSHSSTVIVVPGSALMPIACTGFVSSINPLRDSESIKRHKHNLENSEIHCPLIGLNIFIYQPIYLFQIKEFIKLATIYITLELFDDNIVLPVHR